MLRCRFYEDPFPEIEDVVVVNVQSIQEMGAYVRLLEYNDKEGMILLSELSRRRIRSINKLIRVGRNEVVVVIRVDRDKGYIDLSKRRVSAEEVAKCEEKFAKAKAVNQILRHVAEGMKFDSDAALEDLCMKTAWKFDKKLGKKGAAFDVFKQAVTNPEVLDECEISDGVKNLLLSDIKRRLMPQAVKIRTDFEVSCFNYEGIDAIKSALRKGMALSTEELPIKIHLIAPPLYVMTTQTLERSDGLERLKEALEAIRIEIELQGGGFKVQQAPRVVSDTDEAELRRHMAALEVANQEISGDDSDEEGSEGSDENGDEEGGDEDKSAGAGDKSNGAADEA